MCQLVVYTQFVSMGTGLRQNSMPVSTGSRFRKQPETVPNASLTLQHFMTLFTACTYTRTIFTHMPFSTHTRTRTCTKHAHPQQSSAIESPSITGNGWLGGYRMYTYVCKNFTHHTHGHASQELHVSVWHRMLNCRESHAQKLAPDYYFSGAEKPTTQWTVLTISEAGGCWLHSRYTVFSNQKTL